MNFASSFIIFIDVFFLSLFILHCLFTIFFIKFLCYLITHQYSPISIITFITLSILILIHNFHAQHRHHKTVLMTIWNYPDYDNNFPQQRRRLLSHWFALFSKRFLWQRITSVGLTQRIWKNYCVRFFKKRHNHKKNYFVCISFFEKYYSFTFFWVKLF